MIYKLFFVLFIMMLSMSLQANNNQDFVIKENQQIAQSKEMAVILDNMDIDSSFDFNQDGLMDKLSLTKPAGSDVRNFNVTIKILKNTGNGYQALFENSKMLEEPTTGCGLDGLEAVSARGNQLNIFYITCADRTFATGNLMFVYDNVLNEFILQKHELLLINDYEDANDDKLVICETKGETFSEFDGACYPVNSD